MAEYWKTIIRDDRDAFRTYVSNPALFKRLDGLDKHLSILDAGCGEGYVSRRLTSQGHKVTGIDISKPLIDYAKELATTEIYETCDVTKMPYADETFDAAVSNFLLVELEKPETAIQEISRVLKPKGKFIFQILNPKLKTLNSGEIGGEEGDYFTTKRYAEKFIVDGLESPRAAVRYHNPLERYEESLEKSGLKKICSISPSPTEETPNNHPMFEILKQPWFVLMEYEKQ
ncbi:class I SAM-dependent methyltransferase [Methanococcoides sp. SA1]|nr:class I SAM-dependent methyltransferase [Methanococcoides sp. SA1]